jgi:hypothetical protein
MAFIAERPLQGAVADIDVVAVVGMAAIGREEDWRI